MGLGHLMELMVISNARYLCLPTAFGIRKILRSIGALQQTLKALTNDTQQTDFDRAKRYYSLFFELPQVCHPAQLHISAVKTLSGYAQWDTQWTRTIFHI